MCGKYSILFDNINFYQKTENIVSMKNIQDDTKIAGSYTVSYWKG